MAKKTLFITLALIYLCSLGCSDILNAQAAKDRDLAHVVEENLKTSMRFRDTVVSFIFIDIGEYQITCKNLNDGETVAKFAYNTMVVLDERNANKVRTGRNKFTMIGIQNNETIFEVVYGSGFARPQVTLMGPYEGETYEF